MAATAAATARRAAAPPPAVASESDDDEFVDARESLTSPSTSLAGLPAQIPHNYSRIEPLPSPIPPLDNELSIFRLAREVISSVKPGADVTNINLPAYILDPVSALEKTKKSMQRGELLQDISAAQDAHTRFLNVLRFNFSGLAKERFGKKPYNPVLGEVYRCCFPHRGAAGETLLVSEQVSHHPPITALHLRNDTLGFRMNSFTAPEPRFWGNTLEVKLRGEIRIVLTKFDNEEYIITRPYVYMSGLFAGKQRLEFNGSSSFSCPKSGLGAEIHYKTRGPLALRGDINGVTGRIFKLANNETLHTMDGHWDKKIMLMDVRTNTQKTLFDYEAIIAEKSMVAVLPPPHEEENSFSTRVWAKCSEAIKTGDTAAANAEKRRIEDHQRKLRKERKEAAVPWQWHYFVKREDVQEGYDLRPDLAPNGLLKLSLTAQEIAGLRSGNIVRDMQIEMLAENDNPEPRKLGGGRLKVFGRGRGKV
ncbi:unnamed protein product [Chondrus crispus]|uniref:Oxysterol-binding protein n=1 Tax=Chondrus crispus TaxID=2769 RepID=R7QDP6_CHOCR|nr:unnamed protein product [Chondrus crispus]CDF35893.1 unnamed protein product [Chondrus crispus]|eukprot:XP_005715712.1 unnamed protein product [Chondrus crispus]